MKAMLKIGVSIAAILLAASPALADCGIPAGSVRLLSNDFEALRIVATAAEVCASPTVKFTKNQTKEHKNLQVPALTVNPAEYTVAFVANNSVVPLLNGGLLRPLDDLVAAYGQDLQPNQLVKIDGKIMAIAFMGNTQHFFYRKDLLEKAGLAVPTSYEEILAAAKVLKDKGLMKYPLGANDKAGWDLAAEFVNMYLGYGGEFFKPGSAAPSINNEKGIGALNTMKALTAFMDPDFMTYNTEELKAIWGGNKIAMMNQWGSIAGAIIDPNSSTPEISAQTGIAGAPTVGGGKIPAAALWWDGFAIAKNISDVDAEASFRAAVTGIKPEVALANRQVAAWLTKGFTPSPASTGVLATAKAQAKPYPMQPYMGLMHTALGNELVDFMKGAKTAEKALADVEASYSAAAREGGFLK